MPTFKKYSAFKACEYLVQSGPMIYSPSSAINRNKQVREFKITDGTVYNWLVRYANSAADETKINKNFAYLSAGTVKASADDYDVNDYNGTSTGSCQFTKSSQTGGVAYQIQFTASENSTIKCFKFFSTLYVYNSNTNAQQEKSCLMFAIYFDEPISVMAGQIKNMSINFAYDEEQVTII